MSDHESNGTISSPEDVITIQDSETRLSVGMFSSTRNDHDGDPHRDDTFFPDTENNETTKAVENENASNIESLSVVGAGSSNMPLDSIL